MGLTELEIADIRGHVDELGLLSANASHFENIDTYFDYLSLPESIKNDKVVSLFAVSNNSFNYNFVPDDAKNSEFIVASLKHNRNIFSYLSQSELIKKGVLSYIVKTEPALIEHYPEMVKAKADFWETVISMKPELIELASSDVRQELAKRAFAKMPIETADKKPLSKEQDKVVELAMKRK